MQRSRIRRALTAATTVLALTGSAAVVGIGASIVTASPAAAVGKYSNASIADLALKHVGQQGGQCRIFVNNMISAASGGTQNTYVGGDDYFSSFLREGGIRITDQSKLAKGDIVQVGQWGSSAGLHTFIIVGHVSGSTWDVVDSNHITSSAPYGDEKVYHYHRTFTLSSTTRAYRMGTVSGSSSWGGVGTSAKYFGASIKAGQTMKPGQYLLSGNGQYVLLFQSGDRNLVLYSNGKALWNSHTGGKGADRLVLQGDGNLVMYKGSVAVWNTSTNGKGVTHFDMQSDGNFVGYNSASTAKWQSATGGHATYTSLGKDRLMPGQALKPNQYLTSGDKRYRLLFQSDRNVVLYGPGYHVLWASGTGGKGADRLIPQGDGNLVLYKGSAAIWKTDTAGHSGATLNLQGDGNLVLRDASGKALWASNTNGRV